VRTCCFFSFIFFFFFFFFFSLVCAHGLLTRARCETENERIEPSEGQCFAQERVTAANDTRKRKKNHRRRRKRKRKKMATATSRLIMS
jgi:hypothetical protein